MAEVRAIIIVYYKYGIIFVWFVFIELDFTGCAQHRENKINQSMDLNSTTSELQTISFYGRRMSGQMHQTHSSATATSTTTTVTISRPFFDISYISTLPGILKIIQMVLDFVAFICCIAGPYPQWSDVGWATFVSIVAFIVTLILFMMYLTHVIETLQRIPWLLIECLYCGIWVLFFLIAACLMAAEAGRCSVCQAYGAAAFFGFMAMIAYGLDCFLKFNAWRNGDVPQGTPPTIAMRGGPSNY